MSVDSTISGLPSGSAVSATDIFPVDQGTTKKVTAAQLQTFINVATVGTFSTSVTTPIVDSGSTSPLLLKVNGTTQAQILNTASAVNFATMFGGASGISVSVGSRGEASAGMNLFWGTGILSFVSDDNTVVQCQILRVAGANHWVTISASNAGNPVVDVSAGALRLSGGTADIQWGKALVALGGGATATLGTIGGSGPAASAQNTWMRVLDSTGAAFWVPAWK